MIFRAASLIQGQQKSSSQVSKDVVERKSWIVSKSNIMNDLRNNEDISEDYKPFIVGKEIS